MKKILIALLFPLAGMAGGLHPQLIISTIRLPEEHFVFPASYSAELQQNYSGPGKRDKAREALLPLLRAVFTTRRHEAEVLLTVDAGWRGDSLSVEYKYYKGNNLLALNENMLVEKIYFTVKPDEIDAIDTENDEFRFLYLRNKKKRLNIHQFVSRPALSINEVSWQSSMGFPVRTENLPQIIQLLKDLRQDD